MSVTPKPAAHKLTEERRLWLYGVIIAAIAILSGYGILGPDEVPLWTALIVAVLGVGGPAVAAANVGREPEQYVGKHRAED